MGWDDEGWAVLDRAATPPEVDELTAVAESLLDRLAAARSEELRELGGPVAWQGGLTAVPQVLAPQRWVPELEASPVVARLQAWGRTLFGPDAVTTLAMLIAKPPRVGGVVPWHQDAAYWEPGQVGASMWLPLQDVDEHNGALQVVSGSHRGGVLPHRHVDDDPSVHTLELDPRVAAGLVVAPTVLRLRAGQASAHHGRLLHHSGPNASDRVRLALVLSLRAPSSTPTRSAQRLGGLADAAAP